MKYITRSDFETLYASREHEFSAVTKKPEFFNFVHKTQLPYKNLFTPRIVIFFF